MNPHIWQLHADVFDLAQAHGLRRFVVHYEDLGDRVEISLAMTPRLGAAASASSTAPADGGVREAAAVVADLPFCPCPC
jgi:hypothetical protein